MTGLMGAWATLAAVIHAKETGEGESIDCTDIVHPSYRAIALKAAQAVGAVFCGVDILTEDVTRPAEESIFTVTELNFNPSIKIHCYPSAGQSRPIGEAVVRFLFDLDGEEGVEA